MNVAPVSRLLSVLSICAIALLCFSLGCSPPPEKVAEKEDNGGAIFGKETQEIGEFDPNADRQVRENGDEEVNIVNRTRVVATQAINEIARLQIKRSVDLFNAAEGRYPKSHEEFMEKVIKANHIKLPQPVNSCEYQYDVENHELKIVRKQE